MACELYSPAVSSPTTIISNEIVSETYRVVFAVDPVDQQLKAKNGNSLTDFLRDLAAAEPGSIRLTPVGEQLDIAKVRDAIWTTGIYRTSNVDVTPVALEKMEDADLYADVTVYLFKLSECQDYNGPGKLDGTNMTSPGFGCAVERNLMLSLSNPGDWALGQRLSRPSAQSDAKAVLNLYDRAPTPFPQVDD